MLMGMKQSFLVTLLLQCLVIIEGVRTVVDTSEGAAARSAAADALSSSLTVREQETPLVSIHFEMDPEEMQKMLGDRLEPDLYDGKAFIQVSVFYISSLWMKLPVVSFTPSMMSSWCMRISAYVKMKETEEKGYVILSADFEDSISGGIMTNGCKKSQLGTMCGTVAVNAVNQTVESDSKLFSVSENGTEILHLAATLEPLSNKPFWNWANERYARFRLSEDKKTLERGTQPPKHKTFSGNFEVQPADTIDPMWFKVFQTKFAGYGWGYLDDPKPDPCGQGRCFYSKEAVFVDEDAKKV